ncbi:hypothetical protein CY35_07G007600 [Sphagnum magellanicum]|uniref:Uncharacterized protein n=1 Tax=Sphagnum magellanicum TaxID=128215 RepID=A0ACB8HJ25_9BRYO|nr:hypothetical protein CY35_07G007600 [Sphagnum magellanicum]
MKVYLQDLLVYSSIIPFTAKHVAMSLKKHHLLGSSSNGLQFYEGEVVFYDSKKRRHRVVYDDGEQEVLNLLKECWELTAERKGLKVSFETLGMFLATEFAITLKGVSIPNFNIHMDNSKPGKKKVTTGSKAAEQYVSQDCLSKCMYLSIAQMYILGKPSAKASKDSDPQRAGKGTREVKSADFKSSPLKLLSEQEFENDGDDAIGNKDAAKQVETVNLEEL